jgi:sec-independent protein translocase protein TatA
MGQIGFFQLLIILFILALIFGAGRFPGIMKNLADGINVFKKTVGEDGGKKKPAAKRSSGKRKRK